MSEKKRTRYCKFYRDYGHHTNQCFEPIEQIESLIDHTWVRTYCTIKVKECTLTPNENFH